MLGVVVISMKTLTCVVCFKTKAIFLFPPTQRELGTSRCIQCMAVIRKAKRNRNGLGKTTWKLTNRALYAK